MAEDAPFMSNEYLKKKIKTGINAGIGAMAMPSAEAETAGKEFSLGIKAARLKAEDEAATAEGKRLAAMPEQVSVAKPYTNADGTPFTREQMRKSLGR